MKISLLTTRLTLDENQRIEEEVKAMGHEFSIYDCKKLDYKVINNKLEIPRLSNLDADLIIVRGVFDSIKTIATYVKNLQKKGVKVFDNNFLEHRYSINKVADFIKLSTSNIPVPDSFHLYDFNDFVGKANELGYPVICKLIRTGKGARVLKFDNEETLKTFVDDQIAKEKEAKSYMLQKFIDYQYDLRILFVGDNMFCMRRIPGEGEFRANFSLGGSVELFDLDEAGKKLALDALHAVDLSIGGVDMLITPDNKRYILEVNHTAGFIGMEKATGQNIGKLFVEHALASAK